MDDFVDGEMENSLEVFIELVEKNFRLEESLEYISRIQFDLFEYEGKTNQIALAPFEDWKSC